MREVTTQEIRDYMNTHNVGLMEAKRAAQRAVLLDELESAETVAEISQILRWLVDNDKIRM